MLNMRYNIIINHQRGEIVNVGDYIKKLRLEKGLTQEELGNLVGVKRAAVNKWESGLVQNLKRTTIKRLSEIFDVSPASFIDNGFDCQSNISAVIPSNKIYQIPIFASVSAGFGAYAAEDVVDILPMVIDNPYDAPDMIGIQVKGNSMYPKIEDGDIIVVRKQESVDSGDVAVILLDETEGLVKKVVYGDDWIELQSFNPEYQTRRFDGAEVQRLRVVGKVLKVVKSL